MTVVTLKSMKHKNEIFAQTPRNPSYILLIKNEELFSRSCPLALITEIHPGKDGHVKAVTIRTQKGVYTCPVVKLVILVPGKERQHSKSTVKGGEDVQASSS